jgi:hypothetical protein
MKFHGHIDLQQNELQQPVLQLETNFPSTPVVGRLCFKERKVYICVEITGGIPVWVPLTGFTSAYIHDQTTAASVWEINHNLNTVSPLVQIYDENFNMLIPDRIQPTGNNSLEAAFTTAMTGRAVIMWGDANFYGGLLTPEPVAFSHLQETQSATWVVKHNLGYYPIVRVFLPTTNEEIQPADIIHNSIFQTTILFSTARTGRARFV